MSQQTIMPAINFASINCNSLNVSNMSSLHHKMKIYGIAKLRKDIIFLSDVRVNSKNSVVMNSLKQSFLCNPYGKFEIFLNSTSSSSRGVGILVNCDVNVTVERELTDQHCNILGLVLTIKGEKLLLISVYGPNKNCEDFFPDLENMLSKYRDLPCIIGGDWNMTPTPLAPNFNPDTINMQKIPNEKHSRLLQSMQIKFSLIDPFRILHPTRSDFSYIPRDLTKTNRSRIDFFMISRSCVKNLTDCEITQNFQNKLFDHKAVSLSFIPVKKKCPNDNICKLITEHPLTELIVNVSVYECYLHHFNVQNNRDRTFASNCLQ
jgi:exonuclease III